MPMLIHNFKNSALFAFSLLSIFAMSGCATLPRGEIVRHPIQPPTYPIPFPAVHRINKIVIDPGHGGHDPGAIGKNGLKEKSVVLDIAKRLKNQLKNSGTDVFLTRSDDSFVSLAQRVGFANKSGADLFISIHANASRKKRINGFEAHYLSSRINDDVRAWQALQPSDSSVDKELRAIFWDLTYSENRRQAKDVAHYICKVARSNLSIRNRGVKSSRFYVLKNARIPAILIEVGFISSSKEGLRLAKSSYRQSIAEALSSAILGWAREFERTDGFAR